MIVFRPANINDSADLLAWRNDEVTRACFRSTGIVDKADHENWMKYNVLQGYPAHIVLIAESDIGNVGVVRFDQERGDVMVYETSVTVAPNQRGKGMSKPMLGLACSYMPDCALTTEVRVWNAVSQRMFEGCGFKEVSRDDDFIQYRKEPT